MSDDDIIIELDPFTQKPALAKVVKKETVIEHRGGGGGGQQATGVQSVVAGDNITVDSADPKNPIVNAAGGEQSYDVFIYNSSLTDEQCEARGGNVHNVWSELMVAIAEQAGPKDIYFEQNETIPVGSWNLDYVSLFGNGSEFDAGGYTITWPTGCTISSWLGGVKFHSLRMRNTSTTGSTFTTSANLNITEQVVSNFDETNYPFVSSSYAGQNIIALRDSSRFQLIGGSVIEHVAFTGGAFAQTVILSRGDGAVVNDNTLKSTNAVVFLDIIGSANQTADNYPSTHSALNIGFELDLILTSAKALGFTPAGSIAAITTQSAIEELDTEKAAKVGSSDIEITDDTKGIVLTSPDDSRFRLTVSDLGVLSVTEI